MRAKGGETAGSHVANDGNGDGWVENECGDEKDEGGEGEGERDREDVDKDQFPDERGQEEEGKVPPASLMGGGDSVQSEGGWGPNQDKASPALLFKERYRTMRTTFTS